MKNKSVIVLGLLLILGAGFYFYLNQRQDSSQPAGGYEVSLSPEEWKAKLTPEQYQVLREEATEPSGSSPLNKEKRDGTFVCAACQKELFKTETKFESGTGWPSFYDPIDAGAVGTKTDYKLGVPRTEVHCARCGGHLGHVFQDGPKPTGLRYCLNGTALDFKPD